MDAGRADAASGDPRRAAAFVPRVGLDPGLGPGRDCGALEEPGDPLCRPPGFPRPSVEGHAGRLLLGRLAGVPVACLQGRVHLYEGAGGGRSPSSPRTLKALGCELLILTNAAGALRPELSPGRRADRGPHQSAGQNPLVGANDPAVGPRFADLTEVYDRELGARAARIAGRARHRAPGRASTSPSSAQPSRPRPRSGLTGRWAPIWSACRPCRRRSAPGIAGSRCWGSRSSPISRPGWAAQPLSHAETLTQAAGAASDAPASADRSARGAGPWPSGPELICSKPAAAPAIPEAAARILPLVDLTASATR